MTPQELCQTVICSFRGVLTGQRTKVFVPVPFVPWTVNYHRGSGAVVTSSTVML
jgi:hypothetical protein